MMEEKTKAIKTVLFLEDNPPGIAELYYYLIDKQVNCVLCKSLSAFNHTLRKYHTEKRNIDLMIIDDNIYRDKTLSAIGLPNIGTENGTSTGSLLVREMKRHREEGGVKLPAHIAAFTQAPIIVYSVHDPEDVRGIVGGISDINIFEKLNKDGHFKDVQERVLELLKLKNEKG